MPLTLHARRMLPADHLMPARLTAIKGLDETLRDGDEPCLRFVFQVLEVPFTGRIATAVMPSRLEQGNRLHRLLRQMGVIAKVGESVAVESLVGLKFLIRVGPPRNGDQTMSDAYRM